MLNKKRLPAYLLVFIGAITFSGCETKEPITCILPATNALSNSPVIVDGNIRLSTPDYGPNTTYEWTGPNGFISHEQNPIIENATAAMSGQYNLKAVQGICKTPAIAVYVQVDPSPITCNQTNNTAFVAEPFGNNYTFSSVYETTVLDNYTLRASGTGLDMDIIFSELLTTPTAGLYTICQGCSESELGRDEVKVEVVLSNQFRTASSGQVVVTVANGIVTAAFCDVPFSGNFNPVISAKVTKTF